jgi:Tfp pilus assembly protein PilN
MNNKATNTIFTIDLLKGEGIPFRSAPAGVVLAVVTAAVPVVIAIILGGMYLNNRVVMSLKAGEITSLEKKIDKLSDVIEHQRTLEREKFHYNVCLSEVKSTISKFDQWSPVLTTLVENMPRSVILTELEVEQNIVKKKVPDKEKPGKMVEIDAPVTTMRVTVSDSSQTDSDQAVKEFRDYLCSSSFLGPKLEKADVSKESGTLGGQDVVYYVINCVFKTGI